MLLRLNWQHFSPYQAKERFVCYFRKHYRNLNSLWPRQVMGLGRCVIANVKDPWGAILWWMQCFIPLDTTVEHLKIHCGGSIPRCLPGYILRDTRACSGPSLESAQASQPEDPLSIRDLSWGHLPLAHTWNYQVTVTVQWLLHTNRRILGFPGTWGTQTACLKLISRCNHTGERRKRDRQQTNLVGRVQQPSAVSLTWVS